MVFGEFDQVERRKKLSISEEELEKRLAGMDYGGEQSKDWARRWLNVESRGQVGLSLFPIPPMIERALGDRLYDVDGKEYIDLLAGFSVSTRGQNHPEIT